MHRFGLAGLLPALLIAPGPIQASGTPPIVTEVEFLSVLDESHPAVTESAEPLAQARARVLAAAARDNPVLELEREDPDGPARQTDWTLSWQLPSASRRPLIAAREEAATAAAERLSQRLLSLRQAMREVYAGWAFAQARHDLLAAQAERVGALAEREHLRAERGEASGLAARRLDLAAGALRARVALAAAAVEQGRARAKAWSPELADDAHPLSPQLPAAPARSADHPLVRAAERDLTAAELERRAARSFIRSPEVSVGWQRQDLGPESADGLLLGLAWSVPVLNRNRAEQAASEARLTGARAHLERIRRELESSADGARASFERLAEAVADAEATQDGNRKMLDGAEAAFRHGEASLTDLLETHRSVTESELAVLGLREAALAAHRELELAAGGTVSPALAPTSIPEPSATDFQETLP